VKGPFKVRLQNGWPTRVEVGLIGSCTNSSYEDISRAASLARQVADKGLKTKSEFTITPGSEVVRYTIDRDGFIDTFEKIGAKFLPMPADPASACGTAWVPTRKRRTPSFTRSTATSSRATTATLTHTPSWAHRTGNGHCHCR